MPSSNQVDEREGQGMTKKKTTVYFQEEVHRKIKIYARREKRTMNAEIEVAVETYLARQEARNREKTHITPNLNE